jgi:hypothetical protein
MPSGHTQKKTLTPYRKTLLERLPLEARGLRYADRKQLNDCMGFGWVRQSGGRYELTPEGAAMVSAAAGPAATPRTRE